MIDTSDFKNGISLAIDGEVFTIVEWQHVKPGKGPAFVRTKLKNARTGAVIERTFRAGEKFEQAIVERKPLTYLYEADGDYVFMDMESYDQTTIPRDKLGTAVKYLKENTEFTITEHDGRVLSVEAPITMVLEVVETDPGLRGDTASGGSKPARLETGAVVQVPLFINVGDRLKVDTRTDNYIERAR